MPYFPKAVAGVISPLLVFGPGMIHHDGPPHLDPPTEPHVPNPQQVLHYHAVASTNTTDGSSVVYDDAMIKAFSTGMGVYVYRHG
jgi:hypothetical protein